jgi:hypothetical protein
MWLRILLFVLFQLSFHSDFIFCSSTRALCIFFYILLVYGLKWTARNIDDLNLTLSVYIFICVCMYVFMYFVFIYICIQRAVCLWLEKNSFKKQTHKQLVN